MEIDGKIALVLGAAKGIGKAIGMSLARAGATVVLTHFDWPEDAARMQQELAALGGDHMAIRVDLRKPDQIADLTHRIRERFGR
ncbi:MAG: SDR family NAD(P)-dependent oxidoreductase, partial [Deltaproteobacteria bacterium]